MRFHRTPSPSASARELLVDSGGATLSGIVAEPAGAPRALIVAVHGAGTHAGYFDATTAPGLSLLELGSSLGFTVWAPDRPGIGASADLPDEEVVLFPQAALLLDAIDAFTFEHGCGAGIFLVGHSYGLKVALTMAADQRGREVLGIDGSGERDSLRVLVRGRGAHRKRRRERPRTSVGTGERLPAGVVRAREPSVPRHACRSGRRELEVGRGPERLRSEHHRAGTVHLR